MIGNNMDTNENNFLKQRPQTRETVGVVSEREARHYTKVIYEYFSKRNDPTLTKWRDLKFRIIKKTVDQDHILITFTVNGAPAALEIVCDLAGVKSVKPSDRSVVLPRI